MEDQPAFSYKRQSKIWMILTNKRACLMQNGALVNNPDSVPKMIGTFMCSLTFCMLKNAIIIFSTVNSYCEIIYLF